MRNHVSRGLGARRAQTLGVTLVAALGLALGSVWSPRSASAAEPDPWWGRDKALHLSVSAAIAAGGYGVGALLFEKEPPRLALGVGLGLGAGVAKELYDLRGGGHASRRDLAWDVAGTALGVAIAWLVDRLL